jgi:hypothetical protein
VATVLALFTSIFYHASISLCIRSNARVTMATSATKKKATFVLDASLLATAQAFVQGGTMRSMNALVEQALSEFLAKLQAHELQQALVAASTDPLFLADINEVLRDFDVVDQELWEPET